MDGVPVAAQTRRCDLKPRVVDFIKAKSYAVEVSSCSLKFAWAWNPAAFQESGDEGLKVHGHITFLKYTESSAKGAARESGAAGKNSCCSTSSNPFMTDEYIRAIQACDPPLMRDLSCFQACQDWSFAVVIKKSTLCKLEPIPTLKFKAFDEGCHFGGV